MKDRLARLAILILLILVGSRSELDACIKCAGHTCVVDPWNGSSFCKTGLGNADCIVQGFCAGVIPPAPTPKPKKPILTVEQYLYSVDGPVERIDPDILTAEGPKEIGAAFATRTGISNTSIQLRSATLSVGFEMSGDADQAVGLGETGQVFSAVPNLDGSARLKICYYTSTSGPMIVAGAATVAPGQVLYSWVEFAGQSMILALRYSHFDEKEFALQGEAFQQAFKDNVRSVREYPGFALLEKVAPGSCGN